MKKFALVMLVIFLLGGMAASQAETIVLVTDQDVEWLQFTMESDATFYQFYDEKKPIPPKGLEVMYKWMETGADEQEMAFICMPKGRALISAQRTDIGVLLSAEELCGMWPQMAKSLSKYALYVNGDPSCASVTNLGGGEWMHVQTTAVLDGDQMLSVELQGYSKCDDGVMVELWRILPSSPTYLYDDTASAELASDRLAAEYLLSTVRVSDDLGVDIPPENTTDEDVSP